MPVLYLDSCEGNTFREFADQVDNGEITHAVLVYRLDNGDVRYRAIGSQHTTYLTGLAFRAAHEIAAERGAEVSNILYEEP